MAKGIYYRRRGVSFLTVLTVYFTLIVFRGTIQGSGTNDSLNYDTIIYIGIYMLIGLASQDYNPIGMLVERVWSLNCEEKANANSKLQTIRAYIAINVAEWDKYWRMYQEIVEGKKGLWTWKQKLKNQILRIPRGSLNLTQIIWILGYIIYNVLKNNGYLPFIPIEFAEDFDFIIDIVGLLFFSYTSGIVVGMSKFMSKMFDSIKPTSERNVEESLSLLQQHIIWGARHYGFLRDMIDIKCDLPADQCLIPPENIEIKK